MPHKRSLAFDERQSPPAAAMTMTIETITPAEAEMILTRNGANRSRSASRVKAYAAAMARGEWILNGETVKFDTEGSLFDGQHRLQAVITSGTPQQFAVARGLPRAAQETVDTGRARSFADVLKIRGDSNYNALAAAVRMVLAYELTGVPVPAAGFRSRLPTIQQLAACLERHPNIRTSLTVVPSKRRILLMPYSMVAGLHYLFASADSDDADIFFERLNSGENLTDGDPIFAFRERMIRDMRGHMKVPLLVLTAFAIRAYNTWRRGETMRHYTWRPGGAHPDRFPAIEGCAVPVIDDAP